MEMTIPFKGKVKFPITLDAGVWIFDDRRIDLDTYFDSPQSGSSSDEEEYTKKISQFWDKEIREGAVSPPTIKSEKKYLKEKVLTGTFGIKLKPFLKNAEPLEDAKTLIVETTTEEYSFPLEQAENLILAFSKEGKPLHKDGPVHIYFEDGSNKDHPIKSVRAFRVE
ncbi:MAG TPA: hypothetical protein VEY51_04850 [Chondromyces sp.]|nr:hypothetical protein [Chondromyces sp.]